MTPKFPAHCDCLQDEGPRRRSWIIGKDESRSCPSGPEEMRLRRTGGVDVRKQTRLPVLRIEDYEGFEGTQRFSPSGGQGELVNKRNSKSRFLRKQGSQGPASALSTMNVLLPFVQWVPAAH